MKKRISYEIKIQFKNGLIKSWGLVTAHGTMYHWDKTIEKWMPDNMSLKDGKKLLSIAKKHFPDYKINLIERTTTIKKIK